MRNNGRTITILGLGPGDVKHLTLEAFDVLQSVDRVYLRTTVHPTVAALKSRLPQLDVRSFDDLYESADSFEQVYGQIISRLLDLARESDVVYCVPGSPSIDEATFHQLQALAATGIVDLKIVHGLSYVEPVLASVPDAHAPWISIADGAELDLVASENALGQVPGRTGTSPIRTPVPTTPLIISQIYSAHIASAAKLWLGRYWPEDHEVILIRAAGTESEAFLRMPLHSLDRTEVDHLTSLYVPPLQPHLDAHTLDGLLNVTRTLRAPGGCPWDREQTHESLKTHLLEEAYEVVEALDEHDATKLAEELGDLLFQVTIHSQIAAEQQEFDIQSVIGGVTAKLVRRHPHVFGDLELSTSAAVLERWESFKQREKPHRESVLSSIPPAMPALPYSYAVQKRAANQGFEWPDMQALLGKVDEELGELRQALDRDEARERLLEEMGDLLFVLVSVGRRLKLDPEEALRLANRKFLQRFRHVETVCRAQGGTLKDLSPDELDRLWEEAKEKTA